MTLFDLPSERCMLFGSISFTSAPTVSTLFSRSASRFFKASMALSSSEKKSRRTFDLNLQRIEIVDAVDNQQILRLEFRHIQYHAFDLRGEYVYTAYDKHIIASTHDSGHAYIGTSAIANPFDERCQVFGAITQEWHTFFRKCGENEFSGLSER